MKILIGTGLSHYSHADWMLGAYDRMISCETWPGSCPHIDLLAAFCAERCRMGGQTIVSREGDDY
jgi:hypothetical protein